MTIIELKQRPEIDKEGKLYKLFLQFESLLRELMGRELTAEVITSINKDIEEINLVSGEGKELRKIIKKKESRIIASLEKKLKLVPKGHYRNLWLAIGMSVFGVPLGVSFGVALGNMAYLGIGLPIGLVIGIAVGASMDNKAAKEGRQLDFEVKV